MRSFGLQSLTKPRGWHLCTSRPDLVVESSPQSSCAQIGLALARPARLTQVQLLSHQSKIATRIELFVGEGASYSTAAWNRLGYLSLADNSQSDYQVSSTSVSCWHLLMLLSLLHREHPPPVLACCFIICLFVHACQPQTGSCR